MKVTLLEGLGFGEQNHFRNELSLHGMYAKSYDMDQAFSSEFKTQLDGTTLVIMRAKWAATVEENLFVKTLVKKHQQYFEVLDELLKENKIKLVVLGRGALLWLEWLSLTKRLGSPLKWTPENFVTSSWIETKLHSRVSTTVSIRSMVSGRAFLYGLNLGGAEVKTWVEFEDKKIGWLMNGNTYICVVDVFSLSERAQLPDFGYEDLSAISTRSNLVQMLLTGEM